MTDPTSGQSCGGHGRVVHVDPGEAVGLLHPGVPGGLRDPLVRSGDDDRVGRVAVDDRVHVRARLVDPRVEERLAGRRAPPGEHVPREVGLEEVVRLAVRQGRSAARHDHRAAVRSHAGADVAPVAGLDPAPVGAPGGPHEQFPHLVLTIHRHSPPHVVRREIREKRSAAAVPNPSVFRSPSKRVVLRPGPELSMIASTSALSTSGSCILPPVSASERRAPVGISMSTPRRLPAILPPMTRPTLTASSTVSLMCARLLLCRTNRRPSRPPGKVSVQSSMKSSPPGARSTGASPARSRSRRPFAPTECRSP